MAYVPTAPALDPFIKANFKLQKVKTTQTSIRVRATDFDVYSTESDDQSFTIQWSYYREGFSTVTKNKVKLTKGTKSHEIVCSQLIPDTVYTITAKVEISGVVKTKTIKIRTNAMTCTYNVSSKSSSTINTRFKNFATYNYYDVRIAYRFAKYPSPNFTVHGREYIEKGKRGVLKHLFTGLKENTKYTLSAKVFRVIDGVSSAMKDFQIVVTTPSYVPDQVPSPVMTNWVNVPDTGDICVEFETDLDLGEDYAVHLYYSTDGTNYSDIYTFEEGRTYFVHTVSAASPTRYFKLGVVDANNVVHNMTEPLEFHYKEFPHMADWGQGYPVEILAQRVKDMIDAVCSWYEYNRIVHDDTTHEIQYEKLKSVIEDIDEGSIIEGGDESPLGIMYQTMCDIIGEDPEDYTMPQSGDAITQLFCSVMDTFVGTIIHS